MKLRSSIFAKLFGLMIIGFLIVFAIQYLGRTLFFDSLYVDNIHQRNITDINIVADRVENGEELYFVLYDEGLTDINAFITDDEFEIIEDDYYDYEFEIEDVLEDGIVPSSDDFFEKDDVYYQVFDESDSDLQISYYYKELDNGSYIVFEYYLFGLFTANDVLNTIDMYIILIIFLFMIPYIYWYSRRFSKPLKEMNVQVTALSNLEFREPLDVNSSDEIGQLTNSINVVSENLEEAISKLKEDIEFEQYKDKKRRELIASLSHELKTPITTLRAVIEGMSDNIGKYSNRDVYLKESLEYLKYMEVLSKDLIDAINIESKTIKQDSYNVIDIYKESLRFTKDHINKKNQTITSHLTDCNILVNKEMILRVFINIIMNASKYSDEQEEIIVSSKENGNMLEVSVLNTGAYINPGDITHLFEPFYRVEKSRSKDTGGSGLGLFIIKTILEGHNSIYKIENTIEGVLFTFTLEIDTKLD